MIVLDNNGNWVQVDSDGHPVEELELEVPDMPARVGHDYPETSKAAAAIADTKGVRKDIWYAMDKYGPNGCIADQILDDLDGIRPYQSITGSWGAMIDLGMIEIVEGETRTGHRHGREQMVRRTLPLPHIPKSKKHKPAKAEDSRIPRARDAVQQLRNSLTLMTAEDRVRLNFHVKRLEEILK